MLEKYENVNICKNNLLAILVKEAYLFIQERFVNDILIWNNFTIKYTVLNKGFI